MNEVYKVYLIECWKEAEKIGAKVGISHNYGISNIFNKIATPYFYWLKEQK